MLAFTKISFRSIPLKITAVSSAYEYIEPSTFSMFIINKSLMYVKIICVLE